MARAATAWYVYIVRCADSTLYTGVAIDVTRRVAEHNGVRSKRAGARYTRSRRPVKLVYREPAANRSAACKREYRIKQLPRAEKLALIAAGSRMISVAKKNRQPIMVRKKAPEKKVTKKTAEKKSVKPAARKSAAKKSIKRDGDRTFKAIYDKDIPWESDDVRGILTLPKGVKVKVLNYDPVMNRIDMKQRFPAGYVEPKHTHKSWHSMLVTKGRMCVAGKDLHPGDYVFGWDIPHGPYEYPDGCEVFIVYMGDAKHVWKKSDLLEHKNIRNPETEEGKQGVETHIKQREVGVT